MADVNKNHKDRLFRMVFHEKEDLLALYNAVAGTEYRDPGALQITTLSDVIYMGMKNDISFIIDYILNLWEHQSTWNPNMPLRGMLYLAREYEKYIGQHGFNIYGSRLITLPLPQYIVFYNGLKDEPDRTELSLSSSFSPNVRGILPCMEFKALMLNINLGHNRELMKRCQKLKEYAEFVNQVRTSINSGMRVDDAVDYAVQHCINQGILAEFLSGHRAEVCEVILTEYDEQRHIAQEKEISWEDGRKDGEKLFAALAQRLIKDSRTDDLMKATDDKAFRDALYREYKISKDQ